MKNANRDRMGVVDVKKSSSRGRLSWKVPCTGSGGGNGVGGGGAMEDEGVGWQ